MNQYFLLIACLQLWPLITPVNPASTWGPLIFIFAVSATKEAWDDYNRYLSDKKANEKEVWVVGDGIKKHVWFPAFYLFWELFCAWCLASNEHKGLPMPCYGLFAHKSIELLISSWVPSTNNKYMTRIIIGKQVVDFLRKKWKIPAANTELYI